MLKGYLKSKYLFLILFQAMLFNTKIESKSLFSALNKIKNKVEKAISNGVDQTKDGFKKLINSKDYKEKEEAKKVISKIDKFLEDKNLWANQTEFIGSLIKSFNKSHSEASELFSNKILKFYKNEKNPLITYARDIKNEEDRINELQSDIEKILKTKYKDDELIKKAKLLEKREKNLDSLCEISNKLLAK